MCAPAVAALEQQHTKDLQQQSVSDEPLANPEDGQHLLHEGLCKAAFYHALSLYGGERAFFTRLYLGCVMFREGAIESGLCVCVERLHTKTYDR